MTDRKAVGFVTQASEPVGDLVAGGDGSVSRFSVGGTEPIEVVSRLPHEYGLVEQVRYAADAGIPIYIETLEKRPVDVEVPHVGVPTIQQSMDGDLELSVGISPSRLFVRRASPDFEVMSKLLEQARASNLQVFVVADDFGEVKFVSIDEEQKLERLDYALQIAANPDIQTIPTVTAAQAAEYFTRILGESCVPQNPAPTCIPFLYPDDGCYARAHEMCRELGAISAKTWIYGNLVVRTANKPNCIQAWVYHVAPFVMVGAPGNAVQTVLDPSLFNAPVEINLWRSVQGRAVTQTADTSRDIWYRSPTGQTVLDPTFNQTNAALLKFRTALKLRSLDPGPPHPPYASCRLAIS